MSGSPNCLQPFHNKLHLLHFRDSPGYPIYFIPTISVLKSIGSIVILIPGLKRIKEWAYAGVFFDLGGTIFSGVASLRKFDLLIFTMLIWIVPGTAPYYYWHNKITNDFLSNIGG